MNFLSDKKILIVSPESWDHIFVSKHHYATHLASGKNTVYFLNPPSNKSLEVSPTLYEHLYKIDYDGFVKGLRFLPSWLQRKLIRRKYKSIENVCNIKFDLIWSFDNSVFYDFSALPQYVLKISHIVDLNQDFQTSKAASTANVCFCTTDFIQTKLSRYNSNVFKVNHGFNQVNTESYTQIEQNDTLKAVLVGNLAMQYLDWQVLYECASNLPTVDFVFYGPNANTYSQKLNNSHKFKRQLKHLPNTSFPGQIKADEIPSVLTQADILMVSYQDKFHQEQANPHKMMEYLGSGKVIVATKTYEYKDLANNSLIVMSDKNNEYSALFNNVITNLSFWNSPVKVKERIAFALRNTYDKQISIIDEILFKIQNT